MEISNNVLQKQENKNYIVLPFNKPVFKKKNFIVVQLYSNKKRCNFLIDSGSNLCLTHNLQDLDVLGYTEKNSSYSDVNGNAMSYNTYIIKLKYKKLIAYLEMMYQKNVKGLINIEKDFNLKIAGILGSNFLNAFKAIIDYNNQTIMLKTGI